MSLAFVKDVDDDIHMYCIYLPIQVGLSSTDVSNISWWTYELIADQGFQSFLTSFCLSVKIQDEEPSAWMKTAGVPARNRKSSSFLKQMNYHCFCEPGAFWKDVDLHRLKIFSSTFCYQNQCQTLTVPTRSKKLFYQYIRIFVKPFNHNLHQLYFSIFTSFPSLFFFTTTE